MEGGLEERKASILIVDDEEDVLYCLKNYFSRKGYNVNGASSGEEALAALEQKEADLILLDIVMPGLSGTEVAKIVREKYPNTKIVVATAFSGASQALSKEHLTEAVINKPFRVQELYQKIEEVLNHPEQTEEEQNQSREEDEVEARILFIKAKLLFVEPSLEIYESLYREFKEFGHRGQYYDLDLAINEEDLFRKLRFSEQDIVIFNDSFLKGLDPDTPAKVLLESRKVSEVISFDLASVKEDAEQLEKLINLIRSICIKNYLIEIK